MAKEERVPKVVVLLGSPRKRGNSAILADRIVKGAKAAGAKVETIYLQGLNIAPLQIMPRLPEGEEQGLRNTRHRKR